MLKFIRLKTHTLFCLFGLVFICISCTVNSCWAISTLVYHFKPQDGSWSPEQIQGLSQVENMISSGKYAWAYSGNGIAFYDGSYWQPTAYLAGASTITGFFPGYPLSGKKPIAWVTAKNDQNQTLIYYFDGINWGSVDLPTQGRFDNLTLNASAGYAWVSYYDLDARKTKFKMSDPTHPQEWQPLPDYASDILFMINSLNDEAPWLYVVAGQGENGKTTTINMGRIGLAKQWNTVASISSKSESFSLIDGFIKGSDLFLSYSQWNYDHFSTTGIHSFDGGLTWQAYPKSDPLIYFQYNFYQGMLCSMEAFNLNDYFCTQYQKGHEPISKTFSLPVPTYQNAVLQNYTNGSGVWLTANRDRNILIPAVFHFNFSENQLLDTHIDAIANDLTSRRPMARAIGENKLVTVGTNKNKQSAAFYFDGKNWMVSILPLNGWNAALSKTGNTENPIFTTEEENVWIYQ